MGHETPGEEKSSQSGWQQKQCPQESDVLASRSMHKGHSIASDTCARCSHICPTASIFSFFTATNLLCSSSDTRVPASAWQNFSNVSALAANSPYHLHPRAP